MTSTWSRVGLIPALAFGLASCFDSTGPGEPEVPEDLYAGAMATFEMDGETFKVWVTEHETILHFNRLLAGNSLETIPIGPLRLGPGYENHNAPWGWHMDAAATVLTDDIDESCSALPSEVEANLSSWLDQTYCPLTAELRHLELVRPR